ncbi:MAG TPA: hypothetical protein ENJ56_06985, partial [Anaerolineae bacterium]|nr:hypothetical protein [Anaerolineae bacterium]
MPALLVFLVVMLSAVGFSAEAREINGEQDTRTPTAVVSGTVFRDLPVNGSTLNTYGVKDGNEFGVQGVTVTAYPDAVTTMTAADGSWSLTVAGDARVEFTAWPSYLEPSIYGINSDTSIQFVSGGDTSVDFALHNPQDFVGSMTAGSEPLLFTPEHKWGPAIGVDNNNALRESSVAVAFGTNGEGQTEYLKT